MIQWYYYPWFLIQTFDFPHLYIIFLIIFYLLHISYVNYFNHVGDKLFYNLSKLYNMCLINII